MGKEGSFIVCKVADGRAGRDKREEERREIG